MCLNPFSFIDFYIYSFLVFAYIGGLCVFLSNFIKLAGHYILRVLFMTYEWCLNRCNRTSRTIQNHRQRVLQRKQLREQRINHDRRLLSDSLTSPVMSPRELRNQAGSPSTNNDPFVVAEDSSIGDGGGAGELFHSRSPTMFLEDDYDENDGNFLNASLG